MKVDKNDGENANKPNEKDEMALKANRLRKLIEAKQERERNIKRREEERKAEEKRLADQALMVRPGEGIINWKQIVESKRKKQKAQEQLERHGKPDVYNLARDYNCVKHVQDQFIGGIDETENMSITLYKKLQPCPLRSQLKSVK